jgi:hypothetical protein
MGYNMEILLIGALITGLPFIVIGLVAVWRERHQEKHT